LQPYPISTSNAYKYCTCGFQSWKDATSLCKLNVRDAILVHKVNMHTLAFNGVINSNNK